MAPSPINLTPTYFVDYTGPFGERSFQVRSATTLTDEQVLASINGFLDILDNYISNEVSFVGVRKRAVNSTVSLPLSGWTTRSGLNLGAVTGVNYPRYISFVGRGQAGAGRRCRLSLYGVVAVVEDDYRLEGSDLSADVSAAAAYLNAQSIIGVFRAIDGNRVTWYPYANQGYNAYFQRKARIS